MTTHGPEHLPRLGLRVLVIGGAIAFLAGIVLLLARIPGRIRRAPEHPEVIRPSAPIEPIPSEALVFRTRPTDLAVAPATERRAPSHVRNLSMYRRLRAYPGAPPRIPHGLTREEYRDTGCLTCHERGGYAPRFGAYAPPTPHAEYASCLQCHVPDATVVGTAPAAVGGETCRQCHADPDAPAPRFVASDWRAAAWPDIDRRALPGGPPLIPHDAQLRSNCLACHGGPSAVAEIRTDHPERANCRQCHLPLGSAAGTFARPLEDTTATSAGSTGGGSR